MEYKYTKFYLVRLVYGEAPASPLMQAGACSNTAASSFEFLALQLDTHPRMNRTFERGRDGEQ